jgi:hypothetical protein
MKIAVVVLDVMIEDDGIGGGGPTLDNWWDRSSTYLLKPVNFPKSNFQSGFDFDFFNSPQVLTLGRILLDSTNAGAGYLHRKECSDKKKWVVLPKTQSG